MAQKEKSPWSYKLTSKYEEIGSKEPVYCVTFNDVDPEHRMVFATCGNRRIGVYKCRENGTIEPIQCYMDENEKEEYFAVKWGIDDRTGAPLLLAAGLEGVCKVLDCNTQKLLWTAVGHGNAINDISVQPSRPDLFLTASRDSSVRLWNMRTQVCVMIMTGDGGHTNEVLSVDFHPFRPERFASCGMDAHIKIWSFKSMSKDIGMGNWGTGQMSEHLTDADHMKYIDRSFEHEKASEKSFATGHLGAPAFSTQKVHMNYTDCVRFMGDLILSKSVTSCIVLWRPLHQDPDNGCLPSLSGSDNDQVQRLQEFNFQDGSIWFLRFSIDPLARVLACGNQNGLIYIWDLRGEGARVGHPQAAVQSLGKRAEFTKMAIRQTAVSHDGAIILGCGDSGVISRLDRQI